MNYYKLINGETFVGVASQFDFREYHRKLNEIVTESKLKVKLRMSNFYNRNSGGYDGRFIS